MEEDSSELGDSGPGVPSCCCCCHDVAAVVSRDVLVAAGSDTLGKGFSGVEACTVSIGVFAEVDVELFTAPNAPGTMGLGAFSSVIGEASLVLLEAREGSAASVLICGEHSACNASVTSGADCCGSGVVGCWSVRQGSVPVDMLPKQG